MSHHRPPFSAPPTAGTPARRFRRGRPGGPGAWIIGVLLLAGAPAFGGEPRTLRWAGRVELAEPLTVEADEALVVEAGARIEAGPEGTVLLRGKAYLLGRPGAAVRITGTREAAAPVFQVNDADAVLRIHNLEAQGCGTVVGATAGTVVVTDSAFRGNATALRFQMRTRAVVRGVTLEANDLGLAADNGALVTVEDASFRKNKVGIGAGNSARLTVRNAAFDQNDTGYGQTNGADTALEGCSFTGNTAAGISLRQSRRSPRVSFCRFEGNAVGLAARSTSHPLVEASAFRNNRVGLDAKEFCGPLLRFNAFEENGEAVRLDHKSGAKIRGNRFRGNEVALFLDFSSYPEVRGNRFEGNGWHLRLGRFMSADWESRRGSGRITLGQARDRNTRNPMMLRGDLPDAGGTVDVSGNAWDTDTLAEMAAGPEANLTRLWDGRDQPTVTYADWGTGEEAFRLDVAVYLPAAPPATPTGPEAWVPRDLRPPQKPRKGPGAPGEETR